MTDALRAVGSLDVLATRPGAGTPKEYHFPPFERASLPRGLTVITAHLAGRPLLMAQLTIEGGAGNERRDVAGVTHLMARALSEGTRHRDGNEFIDAAERLGAELHAEAGWETTNAAVEVPRSRFGDALALRAELVLEPASPARVVERLREERLYDLLQARADPRRRVERAYAETVFDPASPFSRPAAGIEETVAWVDRDTIVDRHSALLDPARATLIVAGDLQGIDVPRLAEERFAAWERHSAARGRTDLHSAANPDGPRVVLVDRPGAPQSEVRVGHIGLPRRTPQFHAVAVMSAILGGLFNSRLQRLLREERGYTYGIHAGFEFRRAAGPFSVRTAVQTEVTKPAIADILAELERIRQDAPSEQEVREARDYLVGVFPLRFESSAQVVAAIAGLVAFGLPDDEYDRYRPAVSAIQPAEAFGVAQAHVRPADASIVIVGDADRLASELDEVAGDRPLVVLREPLEVPESPEDVVEAAEEAEEAAEAAEDAAEAAQRAEA